MNFNRNLKEIRRSRGFTQEKFSELIKINLETYRNYEQGKNEPPFTVLEKIKTVLNCTYDDLLK